MKSLICLSGVDVTCDEPGIGGKHKITVLEENLRVKDGIRVDFRVRGEQSGSFERHAIGGDLQLRDVNALVYYRDILASLPN